ncbi:MAG: hypothetical protein LBI84_08025, partial [Propionibacteriaceae bacterium]|nr:hypothetical protein [Propionibacteriaceae bacterium]
MSASQAFQPQSAESSVRPAMPAPSLRGLPSQGRRFGGAPSAALVFVLLLGGMVGYLVLQTTLQEQAFTLSGLREQNRVLTAREAYLEATLATQST